MINSKKHHKYHSLEKGKGNRGEAFFEYIMSPHAIPHRIDTSKDVGVDYLCEWKNGSKPTGLIFAAQVKYYPARSATLIDRDQQLNLLDRYTIRKTISISQETQEYWKLLGLPIYLFVIIPRGNTEDLFYKRYTPIVTGKASQARSPFYKVNDGSIFLSFANNKSKIGGFARDLYIDLIRINYSKGLIAYLNPRRIGLEQFPDQDQDVYFKDIFQEYRCDFESTFQRLRSVLGDENEIYAEPSLAPPDDD